jgi:streptogramin lyase
LGSPDTLWVGAANAAGNLVKIPIATIATGKTWAYGIGIDPRTEPSGIAPGIDNDLWITASSSDEVRRITTSGEISLGGRYSISDGGVKRPFNVISDTDGLWFGEVSGSSIGRMLWNGTVNHTSLTSGGSPVGLTKAKDGQVWVVEQNANKIGAVPMPGSVTEYLIPTPATKPYGIVQGSDGYFWFTEYATHKVGKLSAAGLFVGEYNLTPGAFPEGIIAGPDGNIWFTESGLDRIGRLTPSGELTEFRGLVSRAHPLAITTGPGNALWFTEYGADKIGRITVEGTVTEFPLVSGSSPIAITAASDGNVWFVEQGTRKVGRLLGDVIFTSGFTQ